MDLIEEQLKLEEEMQDYGIARYRTATKKAEDSGRGSDTSYARRLIPVLCKDMASALDTWNRRRTAGYAGKYRKLMRTIPPETASYIALKCVFNSLLRGETLYALAISIAERIEDQIRFSAFEESHAGLVKHITDKFEKTFSMDYRRKHRALTHAHNKLVDYIGLSTSDKLRVGTKMLDILITTTGLVQKERGKRQGQKHMTINIVATEDTLEWVAEHVKQFELLTPDFMPCVIEPKPWTGMNSGGYYTSPMQCRLPFVKTKSRVHRKKVQLHDYSGWMEGVNRIQNTPWRVNEKVHEAIREVWRQNLRIGMPPSEPIRVPDSPFVGRDKDTLSEKEQAELLYWKRQASEIYTAERVRVSKCMLLARVLTTAKMYSRYKKFYFPHSCDFRGRIYSASAGFSPQGPDFAKGILEFAEGKPLGKDGFDWLCIHGANVYGFDKATYEDRIKWCLQRRETLIRIGTEPFSEGARKHWAAADKPYQFLAFCFEFAQAIKDKEGFVSYLPIALDGSCNGLQHFSAMLRDEVGGKATNLLNSLKPQDIYAEVAAICTQKLEQLQFTEEEEEHRTYAKDALQMVIDRKICKKPVMTLPYGSQLQSCIQSTIVYLMEHPKPPWSKSEVHKAALYIAKVIWSSIDHVVIAARAAMKYLRSIASILGTANHPLEWYTPGGDFKVYQGAVRYKVHRVRTVLLGQAVLSVNKPTTTINTQKQMQGFSPNLVHSLDATHLINTVKASQFDSYAMVHDSYGTHACCTSKLAAVLREEFIRLYSDQNVLQELKESLEERFKVELPEVPEYGNLDLNEVRRARYFFG